MDNKLDYGQLKRMAIFAKVVELNSFAKASEALGMSPSGVSEQVSALEAFLGTRLLHRTTRKLSLTLDGEAVLADALTIVESYAHICDTIHQDDMAGVIRLTATQDFAMHWLSPKLAEFQTLYPDITFDLVVSDQTMDLVEHQIDLAIRIGKAPSDSSMIVRPLLQDALQMYASESLIEQYGALKNIQKMGAVPWVLLKQVHPTGIVDVTCKRTGKQVSVEPHKCHQTDSPIVLMHQVMNGIGVGMLLPSICEPYIKEGKLVPVLPSWQSEVLNFSVMYSSRRHMPERVRKLLDFMVTFSK